MPSKQKRTGRDLIPGFGPALRAAREAAGLTLAQVAQATGTTAAGVSKVELEVRAPSLRLAAALAGAVGRSVNELLTHAGEMASKQMLDAAPKSKPPSEPPAKGPRGGARGKGKKG
jgi:transcriptional regulator with XRE-family HTH domain